MARIAGVDLPRQKRVEIALTYIYGIGVARSNKILAKAGHRPERPGRRTSPRKRRAASPRSSTARAASRATSARTWP